MSDAGPVAARPKNIQPVTMKDVGKQMEQNPAVQHLIGDKTRGPGRPPKADPIKILRAIAGELTPFSREDRRQILETLLALVD